MGNVKSCSKCGSQNRGPQGSCRPCAAASARRARARTRLAAKAESPKPAADRPRPRRKLSAAEDEAKRRKASAAAAAKRGMRLREPPPAPVMPASVARRVREIEPLLAEIEQTRAPELAARCHAAINAAVKAAHGLELDSATAALVAEVLGRARRRLLRLDVRAGAPAPVLPRERVASFVSFAL
jgi:hypothetical protein